MKSQIIALFALIFGCSFVYPQGTNVAGLHVVGNQILNKAGQVVVLRGVNRPGTEYQCVKTDGTISIFDGPYNLSSIYAMQSWKINVVRIPLNEDCWMGTHGADPNYSGSVYRTAITAFVNAFTQLGVAVILDLHWNSNGTLAIAQQAMPSQTWSIPFWENVATNFADNLAVIFDLFNEPLPGDNVWDSQAAWTCWQQGGYCGGASAYAFAGMASLVSAIRGTGSNNIIMIGGLQYATSLSEWLQYVPSGTNIAAAVHVYDFNFCRSRGCWDMIWGPVHQQYPIIAGETGETDCGTGFMYDFMNYADARGISYVAWAWLTSACSDPSLITDYFAATPTTYGQSLLNNMNALASGKPLPFLWTFPMWQNGARTHWVDTWSSGSAPNLNETATNVVMPGEKYSLRLAGVPATSSSSGVDVRWLCWGCINTTLHKSVQFMVNGGGFNNQDYKVQLQRCNNLAQVPYTTATLGNTGPVFTVAQLTNGIQANSWTMATLDLATVPAGAYDGLAVYTTAQGQNPIYMDKFMVYDKNDNSNSSPASRTMAVFSISVLLALLIL